MEENPKTTTTPTATPPLQGVPSPIQAPTTLPQSQSMPSTPVIPPPLSSLPPSTKHKNTGILIVGTVLLLLVVLLGGLYYVILKQSFQNTAKSAPVYPTQKPTAAPVPTTATSAAATIEEKDVQGIQITDPTQDINQINKDLNSL